MRAAIFEAVGRPLSLATVSEPGRSEGSVILKVARAGICGSDLHWSSTPGALRAGMIMGNEFSGTVVDAGRESSALVGRRARRCRCSAAGRAVTAATAILSTATTGGWWA